MIKYLPKECPNCDRTGTVSRRWSEVGLSAQAVCSNCGWFDDLETDEEKFVKTARNVGLGIAAVAGLVAIIDKMSKK